MPRNTPLLEIKSRVQQGQLLDLFVFLVFIGYNNFVCSAHMTLVSLFYVFRLSIFRNVGHVVLLPPLLSVILVFSSFFCRYAIAFGLKIFGIVFKENYMLGNWSLSIFKRQHKKPREWIKIE